MIVAIGFTYHFQHLEFEGGKVGNSGSHLTGQGVVGCAVFVEIPGDLVQVAADFPYCATREDMAVSISSLWAVTRITGEIRL